MPVVMEISFYHYYSGKSLMRLQSRDCTFVQKAGFSLQFHCHLTVKVCSVRIEIAGLWEARVRYPAGPNFEGLQLCSTLTYKVM